MNNRHSMPSGLSAIYLQEKVIYMRRNYSEKKIKGKTSSAGYVYVEGHGWINIELFLDKIRKDVKRFEQELSNTQKKAKVILKQGGELACVPFTRGVSIP